MLAWIWPAGGAGEEDAGAACLEVGFVRGDHRSQNRLAWEQFVGLPPPYKSYNNAQTCNHNLIVRQLATVVVHQNRVLCVNYDTASLYPHTALRTKAAEVQVRLSVPVGRNTYVQRSFKSIRNMCNDIIHSNLM